MGKKVTKRQHPAGPAKIRCSGCKLGVAVLTQTAEGKFYICNRCGKKYSVSSF